MTKNELLSFIAFKNEQEKEEAEFYMAVKGVELHRRILDYLGCDFEKSKIEWPKIANVLRTDKALRDIIYKYLATLEEYIYGINNINRYLQASNPNDAFEYQQNLYKVGDPVVFITNDYSEYGIYNNLSGKIVGIKNEEENITFKIELLESVSYFGKLSNEIEIVEEGSGFYAIVTKMKYYNDKYDTDMDTRTKLPFQISYAMSIHKAQGLEFDSVKIVITKESDEQVTKNIFYTAVTRAKKNLKVYWQPEVTDYVLGNIENSEESKTADLSILSEQLKKYI